MKMLMYAQLIRIWISVKCLNWFWQFSNGFQWQRIQNQRSTSGAGHWNWHDALQSQCSVTNWAFFHRSSFAWGCAESVLHTIERLSIDGRSNSRAAEVSVSVLEGTAPSQIALKNAYLRLSQKHDSENQRNSRCHSEWNIPFSRLLDISVFETQSGAMAGLREESQVNFSHTKFLSIIRASPISTALVESTVWIFNNLKRRWSKYSRFLLACTQILSAGSPRVSCDEAICNKPIRKWSEGESRIQSNCPSCA